MSSVRIGMAIRWAMKGSDIIEKFQNSEQGYYDAILMM